MIKNNKKYIESKLLIKNRYENLINNSLNQLKQFEMVAFTDGAFSNKKYAGGYGIVAFLHNGEKETNTMIKYKKSFYRNRKAHREILNHHNVGTECEAVKDIIRLAINKQIKKITIFHDYEGISKWANFEWKSQTVYTDDYVRTICDFRKQIDIQFVKVPAHNDIKYNEMADNLAKDALDKAIALTKNMYKNTK